MNSDDAGPGTPPRLLADIGGTNARFALETAPGHLAAHDTLRAADFPTLEAALQAFLTAHGNVAVQHAAIAIATPITGDEVRMTNHHWAFSTAALRTKFALQTLLVVNDFAALAMAIPGLTAHELVPIGPGIPDPGGVIGVTGPGTGLGVSGTITHSVAGVRQHIPLNSEGGHVSFAPADAREQQVLDYARRTWDHVSAERLISGPGMSLIHQALHGVTAPDAEAISADARNGNAAAQETLACLFGMLGSFAGNLALTLGARGGIYIGGGIVPANLEQFKTSAFRQRFEAKGRFQRWLQEIPTWVITADQPALRGVSALLEQEVRAA